jgi:transposase
VPTKSVMGTNGTGRRNRSWSEALKREIVASSFAPGSSVSKVARHYDVNANQVFGWRKRYRDEARVAVGPASQLIPVVVTAEADAVVTQPSPATAIEIDLAGKYRVRVGSGVEAEALRRVLDVLERR